VLHFGKQVQIADGQKVLFLGTDRGLYSFRLEEIESLMSYFSKYSCRSAFLTHLPYGYDHHTRLLRHCAGALKFYHTIANHFLKNCYLRLSKKTKSSKIRLNYLGKTLQEFKTLGGFTKCQKNALNVKAK
jgi:hypothetical protein